MAKSQVNWETTHVIIDMLIVYKLQATLSEAPHKEIRDGKLTSELFIDETGAEDSA